MIIVKKCRNFFAQFFGDFAQTFDKSFRGALAPRFFAVCAFWQ